MEKHIGQIVEYRIRRNGFNISTLARELNMNRRSMYNWFAQKELKPEFIFRIGLIIRYDFSKDFPEYFDSTEFDVIKVPAKLFNAISLPDNEDDWKSKYVKLLETYNELLKSSIDRNSLQKVSA